MGDIFAGRYELVDPLGEGGAGVVWRAWDHQERRYCAAKVLRQTDASSLLRFMREQSLRLSHTHVLAPTGWAGADDKVLFTMPIVRGGSVATLISDFGPLPQALVVLLLDQLLDALDAVHRGGVVHRDVTPANLLLDATGQRLPHLWLGDFGLAAGADAPRLTQGPFTMGTPGYTAPECLEFGWQPDASADLYSAGVCAVEMLTGLRPEPKADMSAALAQAERAEPIAPELLAVLAKLSSPRILDRFSSAAEARHALQQAGLLDPGLLNSELSAADILAEVEVFDHLAPLPPGWGENGPLAAPAGLSAPEPLETLAQQEPAGPPPAQRRPSGAAGLVLAGIGMLMLAAALWLYVN
ncbi:serine/threonine protein kinase [Nesterenkonia massiliensis]|uniref:non-specific serine/threonine protein kinase n=1 Tax=Nesterenkonia massiliensis TaxID=1232429 RepID=A0ABT2HRB7_9MICC|nr:serine/threonine protein kinase [Nesterenkonia massiliensis]